MTEERSSNLWIFLEMVARRRTFIVLFVLVITLISIGVALVLPKWYRATALVLPPKNLSLPVPGLNRLSEVVSVTQGLDLPVMVTSSDVYARMLESRTIGERLIDRFQLKEHYEAPNYKIAHKRLMAHSDFKVTDEGLLVISVEDQDPTLAADITNAFLDELDRVNREIASERVRQNRLFIEERLQQVKSELDSARAELEAFQLNHRTVDFDEQTRLAVEQAIKLKVRLAELDIEMKMYEKNLSESNTELQELRRRRRITSEQLRQLENANPDTSFFSLPIASIPTLRGQFQELYSRVGVSESLYRILLEQLEQAKIQEQERTPTLSVLDRAKPPETKSRPKRAVIVGASFGFALLIAVFLAALAEYLNRLQRASPEDYARVRLFLHAFFGWLPGMRKSTRS